ncbi:hypothetical protein IE53DRAFT_45841 [Violaceomyces palustris]|uniref:Uncharacterized protein n=2 Tax=Violaceomyces palustris TaxID=1673888 RepID=A0ACD0P0N2_9BASI|nr:hypothetical protein IE53DRAFT_81820 [Violaceomyces palustris]PWN51571.1 hypothetical protein IE53DRAFT_45841 [Violaceomyces palustris]
MRVCLQLYRIIPIFRHQQEAKTGACKLGIHQPWSTEHHHHHHHYQHHYHHHLHRLRSSIRPFLHYTHSPKRAACPFLARYSPSIHSC